MGVLIVYDVSYVYKKFFGSFVVFNLTQEYRIKGIGVVVFKLYKRFLTIEIVTILGPDGTTLGMGRAAMSSIAASQAVGQHGQRPLIHYDYMYIE